MTPLLQQPQQILPIPILGQRRGKLLDLGGVDPLLAEGDFFRAGHLQAAAHDLYVELALRQVAAFDIGDFKLAARRRGDVGCNVAHLVVIKIQAVGRRMHLGCELPDFGTL